MLEHVTPAALPSIMRESWRVLRDNGLMVHGVACNDHYAHFDPTISFVNYLQFSERRWRWFNNDLNYQNRLRAPDFLRAARESGFEILHEARAVRPRTRERWSICASHQSSSPTNWKTWRRPRSISSLPNGHPGSSSLKHAMGAGQRRASLPGPAGYRRPDFQ